MSIKRSVFGLGFVLLAMLLLLQTACGPDYPKCDNDDHCANSDQGQEEGRLYCVNGLCQQCRADDDCGDPSLECNAGVCEEIVGYCSGTSDCPGNQKCRDNRCGPECMSNDECSADQICESGSCVAKPECSTDGDCDDDQMCQSGQCVARPVTQCQFETVYFAYDSSALDSSARSALQANAECLEERDASVQLAGNCDERGTAEYNIALGERRANAVRSYLRQLGVDNSSMSTISYGDQRLAQNCGDDGAESCHQANRRVEFDAR